MQRSSRQEKTHEESVIFYNQGGHTHDGQDSTKVDLQPGQVMLHHLDGSTIKFLRNDKLRMYPMPFTLAGALTVSQSPPFSPMESVDLAGLLVNLGTAGSGDSVITIIVNGTAVASFTDFVATVLVPALGVTAPTDLTIPSTVTQIRFAFDPIAVGPYGTIAIGITTAASGAADFCGHIYIGTKVNGSA